MPERSATRSTIRISASSNRGDKEQLQGQLNRLVKYDDAEPHHRCMVVIRHVVLELVVPDSLNRFRSYRTLYGTKYC